MRRFYVGKRVKELRESKGLSQEKLAHKIKRKTSTLWRWENNEALGISDSDCRALARVLDVSFEDLIGGLGGTRTAHELPPGALPLPARWVKIPLLGHAPASPKQVVADEVLEEVPVPHEIMRKYGRCYFLRIKGDSMNRTGIEDGDTVLVAADWQPENGKIVVAVVDSECTIKRFSRMDHIITLSPDSTNPKHLPQSYTKANEISFRGVVVEIWRKKVC